MFDFEKYKALIRRWPKPTEEETELFIHIVSQAHSWYKHLSINREMPFVFYLWHEKMGQFGASGMNAFPNDDSLWKYFIPRNRPGIDLVMADWLKDPLSKITPESKISFAKGDGVPIEIIDIGVFMMSCYLHDAYKDGYKYFDKNMPEKSYAAMHEALISDLRVHLNSMVSKIFDS